jgi:hypothetical protein
LIQEGTLVASFKLKERAWLITNTALGAHLMVCPHGTPDGVIKKRVPVLTRQEEPCRPTVNDTEPHQLRDNALVVARMGGASTWRLKARRRDRLGVFAVSAIDGIVAGATGTAILLGVSFVVPVDPGWGLLATPAWWAYAGVRCARLLLVVDASGGMLVRNRYRTYRIPAGRLVNARWVTVGFGGPGPSAVALDERDQTLASPWRRLRGVVLDATASLDADLLNASYAHFDRPSGSLDPTQHGDGRSAWRQAVRQELGVDALHRLRRLRRPTRGRPR